MGLIKFFVVVILIAGGVFLFFRQDIVDDALNVQLEHAEVVMLFTLLPLLYALNLITIGLINPRYFQNSLIKIPLIIDVDLHIGSQVIKTITYHVTGNNCYCKTVDPLVEGTPIKLNFQYGGFSSPLVEGTVIWDSHDEQKQLSGTLVRFKKSTVYRLFLLRYYLYRILRGISFNLKLPGSESIRRLFVRPVSVMQKEWKYNKGTVLFNQGEEGSDFYLIRKGKVDIIKTIETGEDVLMTTLSDGDIFGEMAIVGNQPRLATAVCTTDCLLAVAEADNLDALITSNPIFTNKLIKNFANRLHSSEEIMLGSIADLSQKSQLREKVILSLMKIIFHNAGFQESNGAVTVRFNARDAAEGISIDEKTLVQLINTFVEGNGAGMQDNDLNKEELKKIIKAGESLKIIINKG